MIPILIVLGIFGIAASQQHVDKPKDIAPPTHYYSAQFNGCQKCYNCGENCRECKITYCQ